jgi:hypothetical protein
LEHAKHSPCTSSYGGGGWFSFQLHWEEKDRRGRPGPQRSRSFRGLTWPRAPKGPQGQGTQTSKRAERPQHGTRAASVAQTVQGIPAPTLTIAALAVTPSLGRGSCRRRLRTAHFRHREGKPTDNRSGVSGQQHPLLARRFHVFQRPRHALPWPHPCICKTRETHALGFWLPWRPGDKVGAEGQCFGI